MLACNAVRTTALIACLVLSTGTRAQGDATPQAPEQLGKLSFANTCMAAVQSTLERGVALLHSFWFREAERAFRETWAKDPECAIAGWGIATSFIGNTFATGPTPPQAQQAREAIERARATSRASERERNFIEAIGQYYDQYPSRPHIQRIKALSDAFEKVASRFPEDNEAQIFSAIYLTATQSPSDKSFAAARKAASILEAQFAKQPDHPGVAHYLIHSYDFPEIAEMGMSAARRYSEIAPSAPHALHMPSHIFTRVGAWKESAATNGRSAAAARAQKEPTDELHAMDYMVYAYLQLGQDDKAGQVWSEAMNVKGVPPAVRGGHYALAAIPARIALERGAWSEAAKLEPRENPFPFAKSHTHYARAVGLARSGDPRAAQADVQELSKLVESLKGKDDYWAKEVEVQRLTAAAWVEFATGDRDKGLALMRSAADSEDANEKSPVTPARMLPARELLGDMLLAADKPSDALAAYESSHAREPNRYRGLFGAGLAAASASQPDKARQYFTKLMAMAGPGVRAADISVVRKYVASK